MKNQPKSEVFSWVTPDIEKYTKQNQVFWKIFPPRFAYHTTEEECEHLWSQLHHFGIDFSPSVFSCTRAHPWRFSFFTFTTFTQRSVKWWFKVFSHHQQKSWLKTPPASHILEFYMQLKDHLVKKCPKETFKALTHIYLQRFLWRLWKQKVQICCSVRARTRVRRLSKH